MDEAEAGRSSDRRSAAAAAGLDRAHEPQQGRALLEARGGSFMGTAHCLNLCLLSFCLHLTVLYPPPPTHKNFTLCLANGEANISHLTPLDQKTERVLKLPQS